MLFAKVETIRTLLSLAIAVVIAALCATIFAVLLPLSVGARLLLWSGVLALTFTAIHDSINLRRAALHLRLRLQRRAA